MGWARPSLKLIGECGTDLRAWPSAKQFISWLCLAQGNKISGGTVFAYATILQSSSCAVGLAATTVGRSDTALGAFYRRLSSRAGKWKAVTATAHKIAAFILQHAPARHGMGYRDPGADQYERQYRSRVLANLQRRAKSLGFVLQAIPGDANPAVS